jgi:hypothetical protein
MLVGAPVQHRVEGGGALGRQRGGQQRPERPLARSVGGDRVRGEREPCMRISMPPDGTGDSGRMALAEAHSSGSRSAARMSSYRVPTQAPSRGVTKIGAFSQARA